MRFYTVRPEVAGGFGANTVLDASSHPPRVIRLHYEFQGWLGDDLVASFPCYLVSERLRRALETLDRASGFAFAEVEVTLDEQFRMFYPDVAESLPTFWWLQVTGEPGVHDMGLAAPARLVVSQRVLDMLQAHNLTDAEIAEHGVAT